MTSPTPAVTIVTVTWNSAATIGACLEALPDATAAAIEAVVVDNSSGDDTVAVVSRVAAELAFPIEVVERADNPGFSVGCNDGLARAAGAWVLFLNPDAVCPPGSIDALVTVAAARPDAGIVAPALVGSDGHLQPTVERTYGLGRVLLGMARLGGANRPAAPPEGGPPIEVPWVHAAAILMPTALARNLGGFDSRYFMYAEDMDLCTRVRAHGHAVLVVPEVRVRHLGGASAELAGGAPVTAARRVEGMARYLSIHQGRWAARVFALATAATAAMGAAASAAGRRPSAIHRAKAAAALRALRPGASRPGAS